MIKQHTTHRNNKGVWFRYQGQGRFILARKDGYGRWVHGRIQLPSVNDIDMVRPDSISHWSHYSFPTYNQALSAGEGNRVL